MAKLEFPVLHREALNLVADKHSLSRLDPSMELRVYFEHTLDLICVGMGLMSTTSIDATGYTTEDFCVRSKPKSWWAWIK